MARPYSLDLRERVVASVEGGRELPETARLFAISVASVGVDAAQAADRERGGQADGRRNGPCDPAE